MDCCPGIPRPVSLKAGSTRQTGLNKWATGRFIVPASEIVWREAFYPACQPVVLGSGSDSRTVLRLVIGMRFFNIVGHAGPGGMAAALQSEISDLIRAIDKLEILVRYWWSYRDDLA